MHNASSCIYIYIPDGKGVVLKQYHFLWFLSGVPQLHVGRGELGNSLGALGSHQSQNFAGGRPMLQSGLLQPSIMHTKLAVSCQHHSKALVVAITGVLCPQPSISPLPGDRAQASTAL